jgi:hypothetical protein
LTIAPAALAAAAIAALLALRFAGAGFHGDPHAVVRDAAPGSRLWDVAGRRAPVLGVALLAWLAAFGLAMAGERLLHARSAVPLPHILGQRNSGRTAARLLALSLVYLPLLCLAGAALEPSVGAERLLVMLGSPALAALTLAAFGGNRALGAYAALAFACGATALAYAIDLIGGSPLTQLSLVGPNPAAGHRFYGIGNELEAALVVLILVGTGAALSLPLLVFRTMSGKPTAEGPVGARRRGAAAFLVVAVVFAFAFAYGAYGADVGAAISLPLGAGVAAALLVGRPRLALLAFALPIPALIVLSAADLLTGDRSHLTRTVLDAKSGGGVLAVLDHRLGETARSFLRPTLLPGLPVTIVAATVAWLRRDRLAAWLRGRPAMSAGMLGAVAATVVGTLANDSGALLLEIGAAYLLVFIAFAWAEAADQAGRYP